MLSSHLPGHPSDQVPKGVRSSNPGRAKNFHCSISSRSAVGVHPTSYPMRTSGPFTGGGGSCRGENLTNLPPTNTEVKKM
jgi:hypothetical protein